MTNDELIAKIEAKGLCYICDWDGDDYGCKEKSEERDLILEALRASRVQPQPTWIPVSERLYEGSDRVVILIDQPRDSVIWVGPMRADWCKHNHASFWSELPKRHDAASQRSSQEGK